MNGFNLYLDRQKFLNDLSDHPQSILLPEDIEIRDHCRHIVASLPWLPEMSRSVGKNILLQ